MPCSNALVLKAEANKHKVIKLLHCSDADFEAFEAYTVMPNKRAKVWPVIELDATEVHSLGDLSGVVQSLRGLRTLFKTHSMRTDVPFIKHLLHGKGCCTTCHTMDSVAGITKLDGDSLRQHSVNPKSVRVNLIVWALT